MILFLIGLFILGFLFVNLFNKQLPALFLGLVAPLIGLIVFAFDVLCLLLVNIRVTLAVIVVMVCAEIILLAVYQLFFSKVKINFHDSIYKVIAAIAVAYFVGVIIFTTNVLTFISNDTMYMTVMAQNILDTGLSKWYFASPTGMGIFVPILQTIGMFFGYGYSWFVQPVISLIFFSLFTYFCFTHLARKKMPWWMIGILLALIFGVLLTSNVFLISTVYIHTNFDTGLFVFLTILSLLSFREEKNAVWLYFTSIFMTVLGVIRVENILFNLVIIVVFMMDSQISRKRMLATFVPPLAIHFVWYALIFSMKTNSFSDQMSPEMILAVEAIMIFMIGLLIISDQKWIKQFFTQLLPRILPYCLAAVVVLLTVLMPGQTVTNLKVILANMFVTGNWWSTWWFVVVLAISVGVLGVRLAGENNYIFLIATFFVMILLLGAFRAPYHLNYYDSASRMVEHILPVVLFYLLEKISCWYEQSGVAAQAMVTDSAK